MDVNSKTVLSMIARRFKLERSTIQDRLQMQKIVYLLQACGLNLGYGFSWYKHGPYSQSLADNAFTVLSVEPEQYRDTDRRLFSNTTEEKLKNFEKICTHFKNNYRLLELIASIDFMFRIWGEKASDSEEFKEKLKLRKKILLDGEPIEDTEIQEALCIWDNLQKLN